MVINQTVVFFSVILVSRKQKFLWMTMNSKRLFRDLTPAEKKAKSAISKHCYYDSYINGYAILNL